MNAIKDCISNIVENIENTHIGLAFSGGVDSSILAKVCKDLGKDITLLTISFDNERDIEFSNHVANDMDMKIITKNVSLGELEHGLKKVLDTIEFERFARFSNCVCFYYVFQLAKENKIKNVICANGPDELFCGYSRYKTIYPDEVKINDCIKKLVKVAESDKKEIEKIAEIFNAIIGYPFMSEEFVKLSMDVPLEEKITGKDDELRKHAIRKLALDIGVPEISAMKPKKAFQYSSGVQKAMRRLAKQKGFTKSKSNELGFSSETEAYLKSLK